VTKLQNFKFAEYPSKLILMVDGAIRHSPSKLLEIFLLVFYAQPLKATDPRLLKEVGDLVSKQY